MSGSAGVGARSSFCASEHKQVLTPPTVGSSYAPFNQEGAWNSKALSEARVKTSPEAYNIKAEVQRSAIVKFYAQLSILLSTVRYCRQGHAQSRCNGSNQ